MNKIIFKSSSLDNSKIVSWEYEEGKLIFM